MYCDVRGICGALRESRRGLRPGRDVQVVQVHSWGGSVGQWPHVVHGGEVGGEVLAGRLLAHAPHRPGLVPRVARSGLHAEAAGLEFGLG